MWNSKTETVSLLLTIGGFTLVAVVAVIIAPIIINIKQGGFYAILTIVVLLGLICGVIYLLRCRSQRNKKLKDNKTKAV